MTKQEMVSVLVDAVRRVQEETQASKQEVLLTTAPMNDLDGFDSPRGLELTCEINDLLPFDIPLDENIFVDKEANELRTIGEIADHLLTLEEACRVAR